jgi:hypothetical protein
MLMSLLRDSLFIFWRESVLILVGGFTDHYSEEMTTAFIFLRDSVLNMNFLKHLVLYLGGIHSEIYRSLW